MTRKVGGWTADEWARWSAAGYGPMCAPERFLAVELPLAEDELADLERACRGETDCGLAGRYGACSPEDVLRLVAEGRRLRETLALIAEHRLTVTPEGDGWFVSTAPGRALGGRFAMTIGEAVRACVERIRSGQ